LLTECISSFRLMAEDASVTLSDNIDANLPNVRGDGQKLRQVFNNLISNALKFTRSDGAVSVEATSLPEGGAMVHIGDTGVGMSEEDIAVALTPSGQVDLSRARWRDGAGLGLPIARALVQLHGGELKVESELNVGTRVVVTLPPCDQLSVTEIRDAVMGQGLAS
ncbi:MAG: sensor histidine kinase, partial [Hyphomicrobiaceae bacterium]|nr:sensor histidine kinase [Hyphomicrobiaceae bacterium]